MRRKRRGTAPSPPAWNTAWLPATTGWTRSLRPPRPDARDPAGMTLGTHFQNRRTIVLDTPQITETDDQLTAFIPLTVPREEIQTVMGPSIRAVYAALAAQGIAPA